MRIFLVLLVAILILGGGWYFYSMQQTPMPAMDMDVMPEQPMDNFPVQPATSTATTTQAGATKSFTVTGSNFTFSPKTLTVKKGDTVKITFVNSGGTHDFVIDEFNARTKQIQGGAQETITFVADKAGSFEYYCSVGQHRQMGMKGTLTVTP